MLFRSAAAAFFAGVGVAYVCHAIIRAALYGPLVDLEPDVIVVPAETPTRPAIRRIRRVPARRRFTTPPVPVPAVSPAQWARRSFDDPRAVRMSILIGATS